MGIVHSTCAATNAGIIAENVYVILVAQAGGAFTPVSLPIYGEYDSYGSIDKPVLTATDTALLRGFVDLRARGELELPDGHEFGTEMTTQNLRALLEDIRQGSILEGVRQRDQPSTLVRARGAPLGFVFVLEEVYDALAELARERAGDERIDALTDADLPALVAEGFALSELTSPLVDGSPQVRNALADFAVFRQDYGARCTWAPDVGHQFGREELRQRLKGARGAWPELTRELDRYERRASRRGEE